MKFISTFSAIDGAPTVVPRLYLLCPSLPRRSKHTNILSLHGGGMDKLNTWPHY